jgi:transposase-like protein
LRRWNHQMTTRIPRKSSIDAKIGCTAETLRRWVRQAERNSGKREGRPPANASGSKVRKVYIADIRPRANIGSSRASSRRANRSVFEDEIALPVAARLMGLRFVGQR